MTSYLPPTRPPAITTASAAAATATTTITSTPTTSTTLTPPTTIPIASTTANLDDDGDSDDDSDNENDNDDDTPQFRRFLSLPPELRHQIWRAAIPSPGINFFNVHCFPNDHLGCSRSTSPPWCYLDLRRLSIDDADDAVARYDPSSWQARAAVRQSCREARLVCAIPGHKAANVTLTRPARGLFVRTADGQLRAATPLRLGRKKRAPRPEPVVRRIVQVHVDDILSLSVENCSFNLPFEDAPYNVDHTSGHDDDPEGWAYDPQLTPALPRSIPADRLCANLAVGGTVSLRFAADALFGLLYAHIPGYLELPPGEMWPGRLLLMFDDDAVSRNHVDNNNTDNNDDDDDDDDSSSSSNHHLDRGQEEEEKEEEVEAVWDRFGDRYVRLPWQLTNDFIPANLSALMHRLVKVSPETCDIRVRYLASARLRSPKRPARSS
ncbi:hypothetical protein F5Y14DRAFT_43946 [Nemania sp. NC0429]|nr:hypothetical protein F5Y14DRAFT_43946 [Nemania sp. NC0429]